MDLREFLSNVFFVHISLGGVTWTLRVIVIASFIFPAFYLLTKKTPWLVDLVLTAILVYLSFTLLNIPGFRDLRYMYMFFFGLMIPKFQRLFSAIPGWLIALYLPVALILIFCIRYSTDEYFGGLVETVATWPIIGLLIYSEKTKLFDFLNKNVLQFFGKISYSLYLIHFSILYVMARFMFQLLPNLPYTDHYLLIHTILFVSSLSVATLVSMLVYRFVEIPSVTAAKVVGHKISGE
jgi:peptidoglycan/LPS O-acetylase OafA/YrhL